MELWATALKSFRKVNTQFGGYDIYIFWHMPELNRHSFHPHSTHTHHPIPFRHQFVLLIMTAGMQFSGIEAQDKVPATLPENSTERKQWTKELAERIVDHVWVEPSREDLQRVRMASRLGQRKNLTPSVIA